MNPYCNYGRSLAENFYRYKMYVGHTGLFVTLDYIHGRTILAALLPRKTSSAPPALT